MFISQLDNAGALPALEATMRFAGQRQQLISHNIANLETPGFQPRDVDPAQFQRVLADAVSSRRVRTGGVHGGLFLEETREIKPGPGGRLTLEPRSASGNILFHDRNNRDLERTMQDLVENASVFRVASDLMRNRVGVLRSAISERVS